jgi:hypothetical protein
LDALRVLHERGSGRAFETVKEGQMKSAGVETNWEKKYNATSGLDEYQL